MTQSLQQAEAAFRQGKLDEARRLASQSARVEALLFLAMLESSAQQNEAALAYLHNYLQQRPGDANAWYNQGLLLAQRQSHSAARKSYLRAIELAPTHLPSLLGLGQLLATSGETSEALQTLQRGWELSPGHPLVALALANLLTPDQAVPRLREAIASANGNPALWQRLGQALLEDGQHAPALSAFATEAQLAPDSAAAIVGQAQVLLATGQIKSALELIARAAAGKPHDGSLLDAWAVALAADGQRDAAIEKARAAVAAAPDKAAFRFNLASLLSAATDAGQLTESAALGEAVIAVDASHAPAHRCLAIVYQKQGRVPAAERHARLAASLQADLPNTITLADIQAVSDPQAAVATLTDALGQFGPDAQLQRQLGIACLKCNQPEPALAALDRALVLSPQDQRAIAHRAVALAGLGRAAEASRYVGLDRLIFERQPTVPAGFADASQFLQALAADIRQHSLMRWEPVGLAARNGGLTNDLTADQTPSIVGFEALLREQINQLCRSLQPAADDPFLASIPRPDDYDLNIWATLVREGGHIETHIHEESWLSGAYYVALPEPEGELGAIEFGRPHDDLPQAASATTRVIVPQVGQLLMFPSFLFHRTLAHQTAMERISISFDVTPR